MVKKLSALVLAGLFTLPAVASAGGGSADLEAKIDQLTRELNALKSQMNAMKAEQEEAFEEIDEKSEAWDLAARFKFSGDFRSRMDVYKGDLVTAPMTNPLDVFMGGGTVAPIFGDDEMKNDTIFTNRFRLNMRVQATENVEFKGRLAMYKTWGSGTLPPGLTTFSYPSFDGTSTREPADNTLRVDRAFVNWNNIGGQPIWFSIGRRPTTDGVSSQVRMGLDKRMATPTAYMDWPFDGISVGYAYANLFGMEDWPGRVRFCYGRGFENSLQYDDISSDLNDTDFAGVSWDVYKKGNRLAYLQSFMVFNAFNYPEFNDSSTGDFYGLFLSPMYGGNTARQNVGDVVHTSAVYEDKWQNLTFFVSGGWSRSMPDSDTGMFNDWLSAAAAAQGFPVAYSPNDDDEDGFNIWIGARYDMESLPLKFGLEYNHGSRYWIGMTPGHDDIYSSKLGTRGDVYEAYLIWDLPTGEAISKFAKTFMRLGYQHYEYDYTGGTDWNIKPYDTDKVEADQYGMWVPSLEDADQVYVTFEAFF